MTYQTMTCQVCLGFGQVDIFALSIILHRVCTPLPLPPPPPLPPKLALFDVFKIKALGNMQFSQEHLKTTVYAKFGDQGGCIMGDSKIEKLVIPFPSPTPDATKPNEGWSVSA